ncbi:MAG: Holliday junction branch migration protein RuvA [Limisphaerales bacterium]|jgi:Holliday junction DNA helicase RuvA|nr:Holliday junction branch migration protein RuvA [Verrucomicrobiota bacterium]|tara:strand:- start:27 stop:623 length:597 start_codon:yes stop_codon:yes gene_type:complete
MISFLKGKLAEALPTQVVIDVNGVGYEVLIPLSSFDKLPLPGGEVTLLTHLAIRDDAHVLYGFSTENERDLFRLLIRHVSGIGPKLALNVLSGTTPASFRAAVAHGDVKALSCISGVGKKTAERIVVELKDKLGDETALTSGAAATADDQKMADAISALIALGSKPKDAQDAIRAAMTMLGPDQPVDALVRAALQKGK